MTNLLLDKINEDNLWEKELIPLHQKKAPLGPEPVVKLNLPTKCNFNPQRP